MNSAKLMVRASITRLFVRTSAIRAMSLYTAVAFATHSVVFMPPMLGGTQHVERSDCDRYLRAVELLAAEGSFREGKSMIQYRVVVTSEEGSCVVWGECLEDSGDGELPQLRYSRLLPAGAFAGRFQPGYEGIPVKLLPWKSLKAAIVRVGNERYEITFDPNPSRIKIVLLGSSK